MLSRADLDKKFFTIGKDGKHRILTLTESKWTGEPCFTDGEVYYYLDGNKFGYDDDIVAYWPCDYKTAKRRSFIRSIRSILIGVMLLWFGYCVGHTVKSIKCEQMLNNINLTEKK